MSDNLETELRELLNTFLWECDVLVDEREKHRSHIEGYATHILDLIAQSNKEAYEQGYDDRSLEADHELEDATKALLERIRRELPREFDPDFEKSLKVIGLPENYCLGYNEAINRVRESINKIGGELTCAD